MFFETLLPILTLSAFIGGLILLFSKARKMDKKREALKKNIENEFYEELKKNNINITQKLYLTNHKNLIDMLVIDDINKKLVYLSRTKKGTDSKKIKFQSFEYSDVIGCELINITKTETTEDIASIRDRRRTHTIVYRQGFRIVLNDLSNPSIEMIYIDDSLGSRVSCLTNIEEWMSKINIVIYQGKQKKIN